MGFYTRYGNPNHSQVGELVAQLEGTERAIVTASGMGALSTMALSLLSQGDHVVLQRTSYPGTTSFLTGLLEKFGVTASVFEQGDAETLQRGNACANEVGLSRVAEQPSPHPHRHSSLRRRSPRARGPRRGRQYGGDPHEPTALFLGADLIWHSATKYLSGHSDVSAGVIAGPNELIDQIWRTHLAVGSVLGPFDAWLLLRGIRTLDVRMQRHNDNAMALAAMLSQHDQVERVYYPGLAAHPQHELARSQMTGFSGLLSFAPSGGGARAERLLDTLRLTTRAASLGSVHSIATRPSAMWSSQPAYRDHQSAEANEALIRLSVGIEATTDLLADFENALTTTSEGDT